MINTKIICEQATGIHQIGIIRFCNKDNALTDRQAKKDLFSDKEVVVTGSGAGSYDEVFKRLGFSAVKVVDWGSSAGDWTFGVKDKTGWRLAFQENRYPYYGFRYSISTEVWGYTTFEDLVNNLQWN